MSVDRKSLKLGSLPEHMRAQCARILPRLQLIPEFQPWIDVALERISLNAYTRPTTQAALTLWHCFALGAPLCVLLDLLGHSNRQISDSSPEALVRIFIEGVLLLEAKRELPHGEILRLEDLFGGTHQGFAKVRPRVSQRTEKFA